MANDQVGFLFLQCNAPPSAALLLDRDRDRDIQPNILNSTTTGITSCLSTVGILQRIARNANKSTLLETPPSLRHPHCMLIAGLDVGPSFDSRSGRDTTVENQVQRRNQRQVQHASALRWPGGNGHDHDQVKWLVSANGAFHRTTASPPQHLQFQNPVAHGVPHSPKPTHGMPPFDSGSIQSAERAPVFVSSASVSTLGRLAVARKKKDHILVLLTSPPTEEVTRPSGCEFDFHI
ncbi:hypothetical protein B0H14DRAFT_2659075 [Mycena olivaceomarginata]|nr:hypothetical protein B0H14DRAFT_2659075 [Mycena olivaceomarginata]